MNYREIADVFVDAALLAGKLAMESYGSELEVARKSDNSPVTKVDCSVENLIVSVLKSKIGSIPIIGEESISKYGFPTVGRTFVLIDPIDGTREFIARNGEFTVNVALIDNGIPVCGVVLIPCAGEIFWNDGDRSYRANVKGNSILNKSRISVRKEPSQGLTVLASRSHLNDETHCFLEGFPIDRLVQSGSSLKFCRIAEGKGDVYPRLSRTMLWDSAAGDSVLRGAGGSVIALNGNEIKYDLPNSPKMKDLENPHFLAVGDQDILLRYAMDAGS